MTADKIQKKEKSNLLRFFRGSANNRQRFCGLASVKLATNRYRFVAMQFPEPGLILNQPVIFYWGSSRIGYAAGRSQRLDDCGLV